jgi:hypothetical protein
MKRRRFTPEFKRSIIEQLLGGKIRCLDSLMGGISSESFGFFLVKHQAASANG